MHILYEDNHVIAVRKPHGMLTQGDESGDPNLLDEVKAMIKERDAKPGNVFLGLLHRLDRPVGGVVVFGKTSKASSRLSDQIRRHFVEKVYWAVVEGIPKENMGNMVQWLVKDEVTNTVKPYDREVAGSLYAELGYRVRKTIGNLSLIEIRPKTGRPHQIRVAMASLGTPIVGDKKYGAKQSLDTPPYEGGDRGGRCIALFARAYAFDHPTLKKRIMVTAEPELDIFAQFA